MVSDGIGRATTQYQRAQELMQLSPRFNKVVMTHPLNLFVDGYLPPYMAAEPILQLSSLRIIAAGIKTTALSKSPFILIQETRPHLFKSHASNNDDQVLWTLRT